MNIEKTKNFRNRFIRSLEIARPQVLNSNEYHLVSTPLILDSQKLITRAPLFPFSIRLHGELQGSCYFSSNTRKIPFSQFELKKILKKYFYQFGERIESQTQLLLGMSEAQTPKFDRLVSLVTPFGSDSESFLLRQSLKIEKPGRASLEVYVFMAITPNRQPSMEV